jgi:ADP-heptose:LPS heptosyltransferase
MFTCGVRDFKKAFPDVRVNVISTASHIWDYNPYIDRSLNATEENTIKIGPGWLTNASNRIDWHMANSFRLSIEEKLGIAIPATESRGDIWLSQEEYDAPRLWEKPYWIICTSGEKGWGCKMYPSYKWQEVVDQNPDLTFVQIGTAEDNPPRLKGKNVIDHVGKTQDRNTGVRDLFLNILHYYYQYYYSKHNML